MKRLCLLILLLFIITAYAYPQKKNIVQQWTTENPENIYLKMRIDGDTTWNWLGTTDNRIYLMNPGHGKHSLLIRKMHGSGADNFTDYHISFMIEIPWYKTRWFISLAILFGLGMIYAYLRWRTYQYIRRQRILKKLVAEKVKALKEHSADLERRNAIKTRLIGLINHDIITPLKFLTAANKNLLEKKKIISDEIQEETLREILYTSGELHSLSTNILNLIKYHSDSKRPGRELFLLYVLTDDVHSLLEPAATQKRLQLINKVNKGIEIYQFYEPLRILVHNLISNAIHFSEKGTITLSAETTGNTLTLYISDQGVGMTEAQIKNLLSDDPLIHTVRPDNTKGNGLGYLIIRDLIHITGARLKIESMVGLGTTVSVKFKL